MHTLLKQLMCGAALMASVQAQAAVTNGGFESGNFDGWTLTDTSGLTLVADYMPHGGDFTAFFGENNGASSIAQSLSTVAGQSYVISFWLANLGGSAANLDSTNTVEVLVGGNTTPLWSFNDKTATGYVLHQLQFTATADSTELLFSLHHDENFWLLDDVVVSAVPEPSSVLMLAAGLGLLAAQRRRNRAV